MLMSQMDIYFNIKANEQEYGKLSKTKIED